MSKEKQKSPGIALDIALIHYPVVNKTGETIGSAVTNLDIHDIARAARTFGVDHYYIVTPYSDQQDLVMEILDHWQTGHGATYNPARKAALDRVKVLETLDATISRVTEKRGRRPLILTTSARIQKNSISYREVSKRVKDGEPILLLFGTAHGLAPELTETADYALPPIESTTDYNHLSVRSAVSIILDRLLGIQEQ